MRTRPWEENGNPVKDLLSTCWGDGPNPNPFFLLPLAKKYRNMYSAAMDWKGTSGLIKGDLLHKVITETKQVNIGKVFKSTVYMFKSI